MTTQFIVADVFDGLAQLEDNSVDLVVTSPPFLALRSYLPSDHPDKGKEIGTESTPAEFVDTLLRVTQEIRRVLAPHGSLCVELGDTYAGSGGSGGDYNEGGLRDGQPGFDGSFRRDRDLFASSDNPGWPLAKSRCMIPELFRVGLAYGNNPLTWRYPVEQWRVRNVVTWCRPNPPVGREGDKMRNATSDIVVACTSKDRYWNGAANQTPSDYHRKSEYVNKTTPPGQRSNGSKHTTSGLGAPMLDWWIVPTSGYDGAHYAVYPPLLIAPLVKAMCPERVCLECGEPSRPMIERASTSQNTRKSLGSADDPRQIGEVVTTDVPDATTAALVGWSDCGHDAWRTGIVLDPFAGSGTTLAVASGHGLDSIGIDIDERNRDLAVERVGPLFWES